MNQARGSKSARKVEITTDIRTTPDRVIKAFTDAEMLRGWWGVERTLIELEPGGVYTLAWNISAKGIGFASTGLVREYEAGSRLLLDNLVYLNPDRPFLGPMSLTITARAKGEMAELYLCQAGYQEGPDWDWYYQAVKEAWPMAAKTLKEYLERTAT